MSDAEPILAVKNVSKAFGAVQALNRVSLEVYPGQVVALAGDNGAGKSTIIKAISGVFRHDEGEILLDSKAIDFATPTRPAKAGSRPSIRTLRSRTIFDRRKHLSRP